MSMLLAKLDLESRDRSDLIPQATRLPSLQVRVPGVLNVEQVLSEFVMTRQVVDDWTAAECEALVDFLVSANRQLYVLARNRSSLEAELNIAALQAGTFTLVEPNQLSEEINRLQQGAVVTAIPSHSLHLKRVIALKYDDFPRLRHAHDTFRDRRADVRRRAMEFLAQLLEPR